MCAFAFVRWIKNRVVPHGRKPRLILGGLNCGLRMNIDLRSKTQLLLGAYETETFKYVRSLQSTIASAIDAGAADGYYTLFFLARTSATTVLAFEPQAKLRTQLTENLTLNRLDPSKTIQIFPEVVGKKVANGVTTLDSVFDSIAMPCFVKLDVEGAEVDVLRGAARLLGIGGAYWLIETHSSVAEASCLDVLQAAGYHTKIIPNAWWRAILPENRHGPHNRWLFAVPGERNASAPQ